MKSLSDISTGAFIVLIIITLVFIIHFYNMQNRIADFNSMDLNHDGVVTKKELKIAIDKELENRNKLPPNVSSIVKSATSGAMRGFLSGFIINGLEGGIAGGVILAVINPMMTSIEYYL